MQALLDALGAADFRVHSICLTGDKLMIFLYVFHGLMTFASYMTISAITYLSRGAIAGTGYLGFVAFIFLCGLSHLTGVAVFFAGVYRLDVVIVVATAWISATVAGMEVREFLRWRSAQVN